MNAMEDVFRSIIRDEMRQALVELRQQIAPESSSDEDLHLLKVRDAAELASVDEKTIRKWMKLGLLKTYGAKTGTQRVSRAELQALMASAPTPGPGKARKLTIEERAAAILGSTK